MGVTIAALVHHALVAAGIPIESVTIGRDDDRRTWRPIFLPAATAPQRTRATTIIESVAVDAAAQLAEHQRNAQRQIDDIPRPMKAIVLALIDQLNVIRAAVPTPQPAITPTQALAAIRDKAGTI